MGQGREQFPTSRVCCRPGCLGLALVEIILPSFEMRGVAKPLLAVARGDVRPSVCSHGHPPGSIPASPLAAPVPAGSTRGAQSPSVPAHKGTLVARSLPRRLWAPARTSFGMPSSPGQPCRVTPCVPQPRWVTPRVPQPCEGPRACRHHPAGPQAGHLQLTVYLTNRVCPEPVNRGVLPALLEMALCVIPVNNS